MDEDKRFVLLVGMTVVLAASVIVVAMDVQDSALTSGPTINLDVGRDADTGGILVQHLAGQQLVGGDWAVTVTPVGGPAGESILCTGDLRAGDRLLISTDTTTAPGQVVACDGQSVWGGYPLEGSAYRVVLVDVEHNWRLIEKTVSL